MELRTDRWEQESFPALNQARTEHSSIGIGDQVYIACGVGFKGELCSIEMLRLGKKAWKLIKISGLTPRANPFLSQIDTNHICILGGIAHNGKKHYSRKGVILKAQTGALVRQIDPSNGFDFVCKS